jgi:hypothetical protein
MANQFVARKKMDNQSIVNREMRHPPLLSPLTRKTAKEAESGRIDIRQLVDPDERQSRGYGRNRAKSAGKQIRNFSYFH